MTTAPMAAPLPRYQAHLALAFALFAFLVTGADVAAAQSGGGGAGDDLDPRTVAQLARLPREFAARGHSADGRVATPLNSSIVTPNDSFLVSSRWFQDLAGNCNPGGWTGQDLTSAIYAHVTSRFTVNNGFVNMGTRSFWFGADSTTALAEISNWVQPYGYADGWSQRLTAPPFSRVSNPGAVLKFDVSMELDRSLDPVPTSTFTPFSLASGAVANDLLGVQAQKTDGSWAFLNGRFLVNGGPPTWIGMPPLFANRYGGAGGITPSTFNVPNGIAADDSGNVYVADRGNHRIVKFNRAGQVLTTWRNGAGNDTLISPFDVHVDHAFNVYVVDATHRVQKFTNAGAFITAWGSTLAGNAPGQFNTPTGITTDAAGNVYVVDSANHRIQKFTSAGGFLTEWGSLGGATGQFNVPTGIAVDATGSVYVTDTGNNRIQKFTDTGTFISTWGTAGTGIGQFNAPAGIAVDRDGYIWVVDRTNARIQRFNSTGAFVMATGSFGTGGGHFFNLPRDIAITPRGDVYVVESGNNRFQWFTIGGPIAGENTFKYEAHLDADGNQDLSLADPVRMRIVMQTSLRSSPAAGTLHAGQTGVVLIDNLSITNAALGNAVPPVNFEDGTTGGWTVTALNGAYTTNNTLASAIRDFPPPATSVALRSGYDLYDPSCVWTFLSPGDTLANGVFARLTSPWIGLVPGAFEHAIRMTNRLNTLQSSKFVAVYTRVKNAGGTRPAAYNVPTGIFFGTLDPNENTSGLSNDVLYSFPGSPAPPTNADSVQIVIELLDQPERLLGVLPQQRPTARLPILDDIELIQFNVDTDFDGVASKVDACSTSCAAGQDANGDGCVDNTATLHHVESWANGPIGYRLSNFTPAEQTAIRAGFNAWTAVPGANVPLSEGPVTTQVAASGLDGINLVTRQDPEFQFPPGVLAVTPTTSFRRQSNFGERLVLPGEIVDSDMILNPATPFTTTNAPNQQDLQSVVTHEAGHLLGLSHTGVLDATMFFVIQPSLDARSLTDDDRAAVAAAYPAPSLSTGFGTITGTVIRGQTSLPLQGALVEAVSVNGNVLADTTASDYTAEDGTYALRRLPTGDYSVRITPLDGNVGGFPLTPEYINERLVNMPHSIFIPEWWSLPETDRDDPVLRDTLHVDAGVTRGGINITTTVDTIPPAVVSVLPADGGANVGVDTPVLVNFSEPVIPASLEASFRLRKDGQPPSVQGVGQLLNGTNLVFTPNQGLQFGSTYEIEISPALTDLEGLALADTFRAVFNTPAQAALSITDIQPRSAPIGALITITGTGFHPDSSLIGFSISSLCSAFLTPPSNVTPTSMVVRVPQCVVTGPVIVITPNGLINNVSNAFNFTVLPPTPQVAPVPSGAPVPLPGGVAPREVAVSPDGSTVFAAGDGGLVSVDLNSPGRPVTLLAAGDTRGLALTPDGSRLVTGIAGAGDVLVMGAIPGNNLGVILGTIPIGVTVGAAAVSPNGRRAFVTDLGGTVFELDIDPGSATPFTVRRIMPIPGAALTGGIAVSLDGTKLYLSTNNQGLIQADLTQNPPLVMVLNPTPNQGGVAITPSGGEVLAPGAGLGSDLVLASIPLQGPPQPGAVFLGGSPRDVSVTPEGQSALVVNASTNELHVIDVDPGSATYHNLVSTVGTGGTPVSVGISSLSPVVAVANYSDRTLTIYTTAGADVGLVRVVPDVALPGDQVAVHSSNDFYITGSQVDLGSGNFSTDAAYGVGVGFTVPNPSAQRATTLTLETPSHQRSLALPFRIVEPISTLAPRNTGLTGVVPSNNCFSPDPEQGRILMMRTSPDGRIIAMVRKLADGCVYVDFARASADGSQRPGPTIVTHDPVSNSAIVEMAFSADGTRLWCARGPQGSFIVDSDPSSVTFGQSVGNFVSGIVGHFPNTVAADPIGRYMLVTDFSPNAGNTIDLYNLAGTAVGTVSISETFTCSAVSLDGRYGLVGGGAGIRIFDIATATFLTLPPQDPGIDNVLELALTTNGKRAVGLLGGSGIAIWNLDPLAGTIGANLYFGNPIPANLAHIVPGSDGHSVLLSCTDCNSLYKLDVSTIPPTVMTADLGQPLPVITRSPDGRRLWGVNSQPVGGGPTYAGNLQLFSLADAATLSLVSGGGQSGLPLTTLPVPIRVRVTGANGHAQEGVVIRFSALGEIDGVVGTPAIERISDVNGEAQVTWALPNTGPVQMTVEALGGPAGPLTVPAQVVSSDAEIVPAVTLFGPAEGASDVNAGTAVFARFNQRMNTDSLPTYMHLKVGGVSSVAGSFAFQDQGRTAVFQPSANIPFNSACTLFVEAGARDLDDQLTLAQQFASFTVQAPPQLTVDALTPPAAGTGAAVVISGEGFSGTPSNNVVTFNGVLAPVRQASLTSLTTAVPFNATTGPVIVQVGGITSAPVAFTVLSPDADPGQVVDEVPAEEGVSKIAFTPDGARAYVTNTPNNSVTVLDIASASVITSITVGLRPKGIVMLPDGSRAYVANSGTNDVSVIDTRPGSPGYNTVVNTIGVGIEPVDIVASGVGPRLYVANYTSGTVSIIDANPGNGTFDQVVKTVNTGTGCGAVAITPDGGRLYVGTAEGVVVVDLTDFVVKTINTGTGCGSIAITPDGTIVLALLYNGTLAVIDAAPGSATFNNVVKTINTGTGAGAVSISPDATLAYVTSPDGNSVLVYQIIRSDNQGASSTVPGPSITLTLVATIPVGNGPSDIAIDPSGSGLGLVPNASSGTITFIGLPTAPPVTVDFKVNPGSLNLRSMGKWVKGTIDPPSPFQPDDIDIASIRLNGVVAVDPAAQVEISGGTNPTLSVRFLRSALQLILPEGDHVAVTVTGMIDGHPFTGVDYVKVKAGHVNAPHNAQIVNPLAPFDVQWTTPNGVNVQWVALLHSLDHGATWVLDATHLPNTGHASWFGPNTVSDSVKVAVVEVESAMPGDTLVTGVVAVSDYFRLRTPTDVEPLPVRLEFAPVSPSPSHGMAKLRYGLPRATRVDLEIFDVQGRRLSTLVAREQPAGWYNLVWEGRTDAGTRAGSGLYFVRFRAENRIFKQRLIWIH